MGTRLLVFAGKVFHTKEKEEREENNLKKENKILRALGRAQRSADVDVRDGVKAKRQGTLRVSRGTLEAGCIFLGNWCFLGGPKMAPFSRCKVPVSMGRAFPSFPCHGRRNWGNFSPLFLAHFLAMVVSTCDITAKSASREKKYGAAKQKHMRPDNGRAILIEERTKGFKFKTHNSKRAGRGEGQALITGHQPRCGPGSAVLSGDLGAGTGRAVALTGPSNARVQLRRCKTHQQAGRAWSARTGAKSLG